MDRERKGLFYSLAAAFFFCFTEVCMKRTGGQLNGVQVTFSRYTLAGLVLLPLAVRRLHRENKKVTWGYFREMNLLGFFGVLFTAPFYQSGTNILGAGISSILFSVNPLCVALLASFLLGEPVRKRQKQGLVLQILAILILINPLNNHLDPLGLFLLFLSVFSYSFYAVRGRKLSHELGSLVMTCGSFICGGLQTAAAAALTHLPQTETLLRQAGMGNYINIPFFTGYTWDIFPWVVMLYIGVTVFAFLCWFFAMDCGGTALGNLTYFFKPVLSPVLAMVFLHEAITGRIFLGMVLMLAGALVCLLPERKYS